MNEYRKRLLADFGVTQSEESISYAGWYNVSMHPDLTDEFIREFSDKIIWNVLCLSRAVLSDTIVCEFNHFINFHAYFYHKKANYELIKQYILKTDYRKVENFKSTHLTNTQKQSIQKILNLKYLFKE